MQTLLLLVSPALFAASIYMILGRIVLVTNGEKFSLIRRVWLTKLFVLGDVLSFVLQGAGESCRISFCCNRPSPLSRSRRESISDSLTQAVA